MPGAPFLPLTRGSAPKIAELAGILADVRAGSLGGVLVDGFVPPALLGDLNRRLDTLAAQFPQVRLPGYDDLAAPPFLYGHSIVGASPDLVDYRAAVGPTATALNSLFDGIFPSAGFEEHFAQTLSLLAGTPAGRAVGAAGHPYAPATLRELPPGHQIALHIGNAFLCMPQAADLAATVDVGAQLSWFMPLQPADEGGDLIVYDLRWDAVSEHYARSTGSVRQQPAINHQLVELLPSTIIRPPPGALLVFDGGRFFHRVRPVGGATARRTLGGFVAWSRTGPGVRYWS